MDDKKRALSPDPDNETVAKRVKNGNTHSRAVSFNMDVDPRVMEDTV